MRGREGIVLSDPPDPKSGHAIPRTEANLVTISHDHAGHASLKSIAGEPVVLRGPGEYEVREVLVTGLGTFHDDEKGTLRGRNTVFAIRLDELVTTTTVLALDRLLSEDSTFYGDLFPHAVRWKGIVYLEDGLHRAVRAALRNRTVLHARVIDMDMPLAQQA